MNPELARRGQSAAVALVLLLGLVACAGAGAFLLLREHEPEPPAPPDAPLAPAVLAFALTADDAKETMEAPTLATDATGTVFVAWASRTGANERSLFVSRAGGAGRPFDPPALVTKSAVYKAVSQMKGQTITREVKMAPHLVSAERGAHLAWTEALPNGAGVRSVVAHSADGRTFGAPVPFNDGTESRSTFTALAAGPNGALLASWLDNRNGPQQCFAALRKPGAAGFEPALQVHAGEPGKGVCPCCPTAALVGPDGALYVAFRNVANGFRDIAVGALRPGARAFEVVPVGPPAWTFNGCPHDGPSLARVGDTLHVAWMDARTGTPRCYHASANLSDLKFGAARELNPDGPGSQGNPQLLADAAGTLHAVWEESLGAEPAPAGAGHKHEPAAPQAGAGGRAIVYRALANGAFGPARAVAPKPGAFQSRPALAGTPAGEIVVAWNELSETGKTVSVTRLDTGAGR
jgi:hypothetical protein